MLSRITKNFTAEEFACKCGCGLSAISPSVVLICQMVRDKFQEPVRVTSGCRCYKHNKSVGGSENSQHLRKGDMFTHAADIQVRNTEPIDVYNFIDSIFPNSLGLGVYSNFVHIDDRLDRAYRWDNR